MTWLCGQRLSIIIRVDSKELPVFLDNGDIWGADVYSGFSKVRLGREARNIEFVFIRVIEGIFSTEILKF